MFDGVIYFSTFDVRSILLVRVIKNVQRLEVIGSIWRPKDFFMHTLTLTLTRTFLRFNIVFTVDS